MQIANVVPKQPQSKDIATFSKPIRVCVGRGVSKGDIVIGISTSGAAKYVQSGLEYAKSIGAKTCYLICNSNPYYIVEADSIIKVKTGNEVITGSTRLKAGTATKMVLNMISTKTMIKLGKVYGNLMVDLMTVNQKLLIL